MTTPATPTRAGSPPPSVASAGDGHTQHLDPTAEDIVAAPARLLDHRTHRLALPRRAAPAGAYLALGDADGEPLLLPLSGSVTHVGRSATADLRIEERRISRHHAIIVRHGHAARLLDNRSANGTWLNGRPIIAGDLQDGDVIRLGPVLLRYHEVR